MCKLNIYNQIIEILLFLFSDWQFVKHLITACINTALKCDVVLGKVLVCDYENDHELDKRQLVVECLCRYL